MPAKASSSDIDGRFREVISDPLNVLIPRHPEAGNVVGECVVLHNGHRVPLSGAGAYYGDFSKILIYNRGVHEPLEEYAFLHVLAHLPPAPVMIELGAYWGHYAMWLKQARPDADVTLVEPEAENLAAGRANFARNGYNGSFVQDFVSQEAFAIDAWMEKTGHEKLHVLHSDIQGYEGQMLDGAATALTSFAIDYVFVSTHSQSLHQRICRKLTDAGYRIEMSADFLNETTSFDGFVLAVSPHATPVFTDTAFMGREEIAQAKPKELLAYVARRLAADS
jgi:hypothetical protein